MASAHPSDSALARPIHNSRAACATNALRGTRGLLNVPRSNAVSSAWTASPAGRARPPRLSWCVGQTGRRAAACSAQRTDTSTDRDGAERIPASCAARTPGSRKCPCRSTEYPTPLRQSAGISSSITVGAIETGSSRKRPSGWRFENSRFVAAMHADPRKPVVVFDPSRQMPRSGNTRSSLACPRTGEIPELIQEQSAANRKPLQNRPVAPLREPLGANGHGPRARARPPTE